ncbi:MAG: SlyX family protein [Planctomycetaceae bacterium]
MDQTNDQRITNLETAIMHLQHDFEGLSDSLIHQQKTIDELKKTIEKLSATIQSLDTEEERDPKEERPPHY